jgi:hypothetical protein
MHMLHNKIQSNRKNLCALLLCVLFFFALGCKNANKESETKLNQDIMVVHNEIMPKMGEINRLKRQLGNYKDMVSEDNAEMKDSLINTILMLAKMEDSMNDWMGNYKYPNPDITHEEMVKYLTGQRDTVKLLSDDIYMSIAVANGFLNKAPKTEKDSSNSTEK